MQRVSSLARLTELRRLLSARQLEAYIVPSVDEHHSEYVDPADKRYTFLSGFTGSVCTILVTLDKAALWTDGRYHLQAQHELDDQWTLMKSGQPDVPNEMTWLANNTSECARIGYDPKQNVFMSIQTYQSGLSEAEFNLPPPMSVGHRQLISVPGPNLVDLTWDVIAKIPSERCQKQSTRSAKPITVVPKSFTGQSWEEKIDYIRVRMRENRCSLLAISALDDIAWVLNLRGSDIDYNPLFFAYLLISLEEVRLYLQPQSVTNSQDTLKNHFNNSNVEVLIHIYDEFYTHLEDQVNQLPECNRVWLDINANCAIVSCVPECKRLLSISPIAEMKCVKTSAELEGIRQAHLLDGLVLCDFLAWLSQVADCNQRGSLVGESEAMKGDACDPAGYPALAPPVCLTEVSVARYLDTLRSQSKSFVGLSFPTISAANANGAVIHYRPSQETDAPLTRSTFYLVDSGGQYETGTTDVTRTIHLCEPTSEQKACYTLVLKAFISLAKQIFPSNTAGSRLDVLARSAMWNSESDFAHGTGHGVGAYLCVHEGPMGFSGSRMKEFARMNIPEPGITKDMIITIEPGYYLENKFGIRLEDVFQVVPINDQPTSKSIPPTAATSAVTWLTFKSLTVVPFQRRMLDLSMLNKTELEWLDDYHKHIREQLKSQLVVESDLTAFQPDKLSVSRQRCWSWVQEQTQPFL